MEIKPWGMREAYNLCGVHATASGGRQALKAISCLCHLTLSLALPFDKKGLASLAGLPVEFPVYEL